MDSTADAEHPVTWRRIHAHGSHVLVMVVGRGRRLRKGRGWTSQRPTATRKRRPSRRFGSPLPSVPYPFPFPFPFPGNTLPHHAARGRAGGRGIRRHLSPAFLPSPPPPPLIVVVLDRRLQSFTPSCSSWSKHDKSVQDYFIPSCRKSCRRSGRNRTPSAMEFRS